MPYFVWTCYVLKGHFAKRSGLRRNAYLFEGKELLLMKLEVLFLNTF